MDRLAGAPPPLDGMSCSTAISDRLEGAAHAPSLRYPRPAIAALAAAIAGVRAARCARGQPFAAPGFAFFRFADGQIAETWFDIDTLAMRGQIEDAAAAPRASAGQSGTRAAAAPTPDIEIPSTTP